MVLKISCPQENVMDSIAIMAESKKEHNFSILGPTKKLWGRLFFVLMLRIKFQVPSSSGSLDTVGTYVHKRDITLATFDALRLKVNQNIFIW